MSKVKEAGTIADIPLHSTSRLYYIRIENDKPVDEGWVTVDEAKRMNTTDRRMHGTNMNRYFQDTQAANAFSQSLASGPTTEMPTEAPQDFGAGLDDPGMGAAPPMGEEPGMDADMDALGMGGEDEMGLGGESDLDDLGLDDDDDGLGDLGGEDELGLEDEEQPFEIVVPRRIRLVPESKKKEAQDKCRCGGTIVDGVCRSCKRAVKTPGNAEYRDSPHNGTKKGESQTTEAGLIEALLAGDISAEDAINEQFMNAPGQATHAPQQQQQTVGQQQQVQQNVQGTPTPGGPMNQQSQPQIPDELQPLYQQYQAALQQGNQVAADQLKNQLAFELQTKGIDPSQVLQ